MAGAVVAASGLPYGFLGGYLLLGSAPGGSVLAPPQVTVGSTALLVFALLGLAGVADGIPLFYAALCVAGLGLVGGLSGLVWAFGGTGVAVVCACAAVALMPAAGSLATSLGRIPMPRLPQTPQDLLKEVGTPPLPAIIAAVIRAADVLAGLLLGVAVVLVAGEAMLVWHSGVAGFLFTAAVSVLCLLRARALTLLPQRLAVLLAGTAGVAVLLSRAASLTPVPVRVAAVWIGVPALALLVLLAGIGYSRHRPTPRLGRLADLAEVAVGLCVVPLAAGVLGLFSAVHALVS